MSVKQAGRGGQKTKVIYNGEQVEVFVPYRYQ